MCQARPEEQRRSGGRVGVSEVGDNHEGSEGGQVFNHVEMCSLGSLCPGCWRRGVLRIRQDGPKALALDSFEYVGQPQHDTKKGAPG